MSIKSRISGAQGRNRTTDTRIFNPLLYRLSYLGIEVPICIRVKRCGRSSPEIGKARIKPGDAGMSQVCAGLNQNFL
jgi:hypothetical protein